MLELLIHVRAMQISTHAAHQLCSRVAFHQDHEFFGEAYAAHEDAFDGIAERIIGLFGEDSLNLQSIMQQVLAKLAQAPSVGVKENAVFYQYLLAQEQAFCQMIDNYIKSKPCSEGVKQLLGDEANKSEMRQYKIKQRLKK